MYSVLLLALNLELHVDEAAGNYLLVLKVTESSKFIKYINSISECYMIDNH